MQIAYFPYLRMGFMREIYIGDHRIWNFDLALEDEVQDTAIKDKVSRILRAYVSGTSSVNGIGVLSLRSTPLLQEDMTIWREVQLLLFLGSIAVTNVLPEGPNAGHMMVTSENFSLIVQDFRLDSNRTSDLHGSIVRITTYGHSIGETFQTPPYVLTPTSLRVDQQLIDCLIRTKKSKPSVYRRILRATDLIFQAYHNDPNVSDYARVVLQCFAFEALLDLGEHQQRREFKRRIEELTVNPQERLYSYSIRTGRKGTLKDRRSMKVIWAEKFYDLRNQISHGRPIRPSDFAFRGRQRHVDIATLFFILCVKKLLNSVLSKNVFFDAIEWARPEQPGVGAKRFVYDRYSISAYVNQQLSKQSQATRGNPQDSPQ